VCSLAALSSSCSLYRLTYKPKVSSTRRHVRSLAALSPSCSLIHRTYTPKVSSTRLPEVRLYLLHFPL
jgi:hypothetical protein